MHRVLIAVLAVAAVAAAQDAPKGRCSGDSKPFSPGVGDWNGWGADAVNSRYQPRPGLSPQDIPRLKLKWAFGFPGAMRSVAQPAVVGGRIFVSSYDNKVYSLDASTGCTYWVYDVGTLTRTGIEIERAGNPARWVAYFGDSSGVVHALDAETGKPLWKVKIDTHKAARITGTPVFYQGRLYVPAASGEELMSLTPKYECCTFRGSLSALDAATGRVIWKTYTIPDQATKYKLNSEGTQMWGPAGAGIWSAPTIDVKRKRIYAGTGNSFTGIDVPTTDAILAFDMETGSLLWSNQLTPHDNWVPGCPKGKNCPANPGDDYDFGSSTILRSIGGKDVLLASQKSGLVYGLDPDQRGKLLWKTRVGQGTGLMGGVAWGMAVDQRTAYAAVSDINRKDGTPGLYALRIDTGAKIWDTPSPEGAGNRAQPAAVTAIPGAVFSSSFGGHLRAYSAKTGKIIWDFDAARNFDTVNGVPANGGAFDGSGPAVADGMVVATSGFGFAGGKPGNALLVFSVDGK